MRRFHGGNIGELAHAVGRPAGEILDFSASINPLGFPESVRGVVSRALEKIVRYPDPAAGAFVSAVAKSHGIDRSRVLAGNGSSEILFHVAEIRGLERAVVPVPCYSDYLAAAEAGGLEVETVPGALPSRLAVDLRTLDASIAAGGRKKTVVYLGQPGNPVGALVNRDELLALVRKYPDVLFCIDEAFAPFAEDYTSLAAVEEANLLVVRSLTKFYAIPGLRVGYCVGDSDVLAAIYDTMPTWSVGTLAQAAGEAVLADVAYAEATRVLVREERSFLLGELGTIPGVSVTGSVANYLLLACEQPAPIGSVIADMLLEREGIAVRKCDSIPGLDDRYIRVAIRRRKENSILVDAIRRIAGRRPAMQPKAAQRKTAPRASLMLQGTSSNAGKSVLAAAFCRIFLQDGYRVAPFKAQNMSLNSFVTADGGEMGRAQVVQAQACRRTPDVRMNPVLLKPSSDTGSQVIVQGKPIGSMKAVSYYERKRLLFENVKSCYRSLAEENDIMVIEGAGSPGEVNLKKHDIVNMHMAAFAESPVLIVGDIDRGGVFASFVGTMEVLNEAERSLVSGFLVNKFRGDVSLLAPALDYTLGYTGKPVVGVVPWINTIGIPEEDSVGFKEELLRSHGSREDAVTVVAIDLPHISNFTDLDPFRIEPDVELLVVNSPEQLPSHIDALILPGSRNVSGDCRFLRETGFFGAIQRLSRSGSVEVVGICGGLQLLGGGISDPHAIESFEPARGLGLLPIDTVLEPGKTLVATDAIHRNSGLPVSGYEIHHGVSSGSSAKPAVVREDGKTIGYAHESLPVWGTYLHGLFDADEFRRWFIDGLRKRRGLVPLEKVQATCDLERAFDRLADVVRSSVDLGLIYRMIGL